jgi:hypothetical protein
VPVACASNEMQISCKRPLWEPRIHCRCGGLRRKRRPVSPALVGCCCGSDRAPLRQSAVRRSSSPPDAVTTHVLCLEDHFAELPRNSGCPTPSVPPTACNLPPDLKQSEHPERDCRLLDAGFNDVFATHEQRVASERTFETHEPRELHANGLEKLRSRLDTTVWLNIPKIRREVPAIVGKIATREGVAHLEVHRVQTLGKIDWQERCRHASPAFGRTTRRGLTKCKSALQTPWEGEVLLRPVHQ